MEAQSGGGKRKKNAFLFLFLFSKRKDRGMVASRQLFYVVW
jgi:hypothetical protein